MKLKTTGINFRDYQLETDQIFRHLFFNENERALLGVLATGLGKTENIIKFVVDNYDVETQRILILAQSQELIYQMYNRFLSRVPELKDLRVPPGVPAIGIEMGSMRDANDARIMVATRQTLAKDNGSRLREVLKYGKFDLWIIDEADLSVTLEYELIHQALTEANPEIKCLGLTATGERSDGLSLGIRFDKIAISKDVRYGVANGWLKPVYGYIVDTELPNIEVGNPELVQNWMEIHYNYWIRFEGPLRHTLHFFPDLEMARRYCRFMQEQGHACIHIDSTMCIDLDGKSHGDYEGLSYERHRELVLDQLQNQAIYATNQFVLQRGFDWRKCDMLMKSSRMGSNATFTQSVGRGTRLPPGVFNLRCIKDVKDEEKEYRIVWDDGREEVLGESSLPFKPTTILLDFKPSSSVLVSVGHLFGDTEIPARVKLEEAEEEGKDPEQLKMPLGLQITRTKLTEKDMWGKADTYWYMDVENESSTGFGADAPYMIYISSPKLALASTIYGKRLKIESEMDDKTDLAKLQRLKAAYFLTSNWIIWVAKQEEVSWGKQWTKVYPCELLFDDLDSAFSSLQHAQHSALMLSNFLVDHMRKDMGIEVDLKLLANYSKSKQLPSEKQKLKLEQLVRTLYDKGWKTAYIEEPPDIFTASNAINHFLVKSKVIETLKDIMRGEIVLPSLRV